MSNTPTTIDDIAQALLLRTNVENPSMRVSMASGGHLVELQITLTSAKPDIYTQALRNFERKLGCPKSR